MSAAIQILEPKAEVRAACGRSAPRPAGRPEARRRRAAKNRALIAAARAVRERSPDILAANARDLADARAKSMSAALLDRLTLNPARIEAMARGLEEVAAHPDPVGRVLAAFTRPNGLVIEPTATPLGVVGVIYESRPNVTADAGALCLKSGNAVVLRSGPDSFQLLASDPRLPRRRPEGGRPARGGNFARDFAGARRNPRNARGARGRARRHRAARRPEPGRAGAAGGPRAGIRPSRGDRACLASTGRPIPTRR